MDVAFGMLEGLVVMAVGMSTVAAFLGLLVISMQVTATVVARAFPDPAPAPAIAKPAQVDEDLLRAVAAAAAVRLRSAG